MKLNRGWILAAVAVLAGSVAVAGCSTSDDDSDDAQGAATEQASISGNQGDESTDTAFNDVGVTEYAAHGGGAHGGGAHGGGAHGGGAHGGAAHGGGAHGGWGHGGGARGGWGHGGWGHGGWGRGGWGHWNGWRHDGRYPWWW
jgi:hypothetical protein